EQDAADNDVEVARQNSLEEKRAEARPAHNDLDEQRAAQERANAEAEKGDEGICGGAQGVAKKKFVSGDAVANSRSEEGSVENFGNGSADVAHEHRQNAEDERSHRQRHVPSEIPEFVNRRHGF